MKNIEIGTKIGFLRPHSGRYEFAEVQVIDGENISLKRKFSKFRSQDIYFFETISRIQEFSKTESQDFSDGRKLVKINKK
jgi:hypothetical protein